MREHVWLVMVEMWGMPVRLVTKARDQVNLVDIDGNDILKRRC
jgi:hypothetical protein